MLIRSFKKPKEIRKFILWSIGIIVAVCILVKIGTAMYREIFQWQNNGNIFEINKTITFAGNIRAENKFPLYTHNITNKKGEEIFVKSSDINLTKYNGTIEIVGTIEDMQKGTPIVNVHTLKLPDQKLIIKNNIYFFVKDLLYIDFSNQNQLGARKKDKEIEVLFNDKKIFSVERFLCSRVLKNKSCNYLIDDYGQNQKENFDSYRWYTFYKHGTGLRTVFDGEMFGYIFKNVDENMILDISSIIRIIDKDFIWSNKKDQIQKACKEKGKEIKQVTRSKIIYENENLITLAIEWEQPKTDTSMCEITFDMRNERNITKVKISKN